MYENLAIIALFALLYGLISGRLERTVFSGPFLFVLFGLVAGSFALGLLDLQVKKNELRVIADLTLALVLFIDAAKADFSVLRKNYLVPERMLLFGLPLIILCGLVIAALLFAELSLLEAALLAVMLAATDAALGKAVITNQTVPAPLREGLNFESGLNDGICVPVLLLLIAIAAPGSHEEENAGRAIELFVQEIGIGLIAGVGVTAIVSLLWKKARRNDWIDHSWNQVLVVVLAFVTFTLSQSLHGSGYIAAFSGGLVFGYMVRDQHDGLLESAHGVSELLALVTWVVFGAAVVGKAWDFFSWKVFLYALLSLTVVRMLPAFLVLHGTRLNWREKVFVGWFGPRGLASIVFLIIVLDSEIANSQLLTSIVTTTVLLSVMAHGLSGGWLISFVNQKPGEK